MTSVSRRLEHGFTRGDIVLVKFVFVPEKDEKGVKHRSGLIISADRYHHSRHEMTLAAITSNVGRLLAGDYKIKSWRESGLLSPSSVTGIVRTIKQNMIAGTLGRLAPTELHAVENRLREILGL